MLLLILLNAFRMGEITAPFDSLYFECKVIIPGRISKDTHFLIDDGCKSNTRSNYTYSRDLRKCVND